MSGLHELGGPGEIGLIRWDDVQHDHVVQESQCFRAIGAHQLMDHLDRLMLAQHFSGVAPTIDPYHGSALVRQGSRLEVRQRTRSFA